LYDASTDHILSGDAGMQGSGGASRSGNELALEHDTSLASNARGNDIDKPVWTNSSRLWHALVTQHRFTSPVVKFPAHLNVG